MTDIERDMGEQPIARIMTEHNLTPGNLVTASLNGITYKMVSRACKGRRLTLRIQHKIRTAVNSASGKEFALGDLFTYKAE